MYVHMVAIGRLTRDPAEDLKEVGAEKKTVCNFSIACNPIPGGDAVFYNCSAWDAQATNLAKYMGKGQLICVEGWPKPRTYEDKDGNTQHTTEFQVKNIKFLEKGSKMGGAAIEAAATGDEVPF